MFAAGHLYGDASFLRWPRLPLDRRNAAWKQVDLLPPRALTGAPELPLCVWPVAAPRTASGPAAHVAALPLAPQGSP